ncbi:MAG TPA: hypothetical protein VGC74_10905 [Stenotrophomonas sp.]|jgi:hypothetical protein
MMKKEQRNAALLALSFVAFSLSTFSYRAAAASYVLLFAYLFIAGILARPTFTARFILSFVAVNLLVILISVRHNVHPPYVIKYAGLSMFFWALLAYRKSIVQAGFLRACHYYVYFHAFFFLAQLIWFMATGKFIDFNNYIREEYANTIYSSRSLEGLFIPIRATGLFSEPSIYSMTVFPVALLVTLWEKRISALTILGALTSFLALSIAGMAITLAGAGLFVLSTRGRRMLKVAMVAAIIVLLPLGGAIYQRRVVDAVDYDAIGSRMLVIDHLQKQSYPDALFGNGLLWDENKPIGRSGLWGRNVRDSSFYVYVYFTLGALGGVLVLGALAWVLRRSPYLLAALAISFFYKYGVLVGSLWLILAIAIVLAGMRFPFEPVDATAPRDVI